jgi:hypothetical protein
LPAARTAALHFRNDRSWFLPLRVSTANLTLE